MELKINVTKEQVKAIEAHIGISCQQWLQDAWNGKANKCIERICLIVSDKQPNKMSEEEKLEIIRNTEFEPQSPERQEKDIKDRII